jgi:hypothetical protein
MGSTPALQTRGPEQQSGDLDGSLPTSIVYGTIDVSDHEHDKSGPQDDHLGKHRQYWRDIILGVNDGLVSTFLLVAGVAGGGLLSVDILLTAIAGAIAGAVSMFAGGTCTG